MKNSAKNNKFFSKGYLIFALITVLVGTLSAGSLIFFTNNSNQKNNSQILKKEAYNIQKTITESFSYSNKINSYLGKQIAEHNPNDLNFILKIFRQADKIQNKNSQLLSWSSFDWVNVKNLQLVNSKIGIRKNPPNMSRRLYTKNSPKKPWTLQPSFPTLGNPSGSMVIPAGTGITNENGKYLGTIVVGFSVVEMSNIVEKRLNDPVSFVILDQDMNIIIQSKDNEIRDLEFYKNINAPNLFNKNSGKIAKGITAGNITYSFYQKFEEYPYIILTGFSQAFLQKQFSATILPIIFGFISITVFFLIILYLFKVIILVLVNREIRLRNHIHNINISRTKLIRATSHDLKNYIFGILGLSKMALQNKKRSEIEADENLTTIKEIHDHSEELMGFVEDLLDTNKNESGTFSLGVIEICSVSNLVQRILILNKNFAAENKISLKFINHEKQKDLNIKCDRRRIKQVINNIINNAIKYSQAGTEILVETYSVKEKDEICISVTDKGIGMTKNEIKMALEGNGRKIKKSNLNKIIDSHGIGMPIIKHLIDLHHGRMEIKSKKNVGTEVKIYFKAAEDERKEKHKKQDSKDIEKLIKNKHVLLAEDDPVGNKINTFLLRKMGFLVRHVENGRKAIEELDKHHFDFVILDLNMPIMNGFEAAAAIREGKIFKKFKNTEIPIIAITSDKPSLTIAKHYGIDIALDKPFSKTELLDFVISKLEE